MTMRILLTNDDGIAAKGIQTLCRHLSKLAEISVVAPDSQQSATSHGITLTRPILVREVEMDCGGVKGYAVGGTPADCVKLAIQGGIVPQPDIVISGINHGQNLGTDVLYSGTVSAAIEGALLGIPALAVSLTSYDSSEFDVAADFARQLCLFLFDQGLTKDTLLNVNVPPVPSEQITGVKITRLSHIKYKNVFQEKIDSNGQRFFIQGGEVVDDETDDTDTDFSAILQNQISVTPIHFDLTNYRIIDMIKNWHIEYTK